MVKLKGVFGVWHGGSSYVDNDPAKHLESFGSLDRARGILDDRMGGGVMHVFEYLLEPEVSVRTPGTDESSMIDLYDVWIDAGEVRYESRGQRLVFGPKGGIRMEEV